LAIALAAASPDRIGGQTLAIFTAARALLIASAPTILEKLAREIREARAPKTRH
jgi:hypothetical protein